MMDERIRPLPEETGAPDDGVLHLIAAELMRRMDASPLMRRTPTSCTAEEQARLGGLLSDLARMRLGADALAAMPHVALSTLDEVWPELAATLTAPSGTITEFPTPVAEAPSGPTLLPEAAPSAALPPATPQPTALEAPASDGVAPTPGAAMATPGGAAIAASARPAGATMEAAATAIARFLSPRALITISVALVVLVYALDLTVMATAAPTIVGELHSANLYGWLFSAYAIPATAATLLYGRLADVFGRKRIFTGVMTGFLLSSVLCAVAGSMLQLIAFRALQGLCAGATFPLAVGIIADVYPIEQRARGFSAVPSAFAFASVLGPTAGGLITQSVGWRWIFFINVPIILAAVGMLTLVYQEGARLRRLTLSQVDLPGALLFGSGLATILIGVSIGGQYVPWRSWQEALVMVCGVALLVAFAAREMNTPFPLLPLRILKHRGLGGALLTIGLLIWIVNGLLFFIPSLAQGVLGGSAASSGIVLIPLMLTWSLTALVSLRLGQRYGFRTMALCGCIALFAALATLSLVGPHDTQEALILPMLLAGLGAGLINPNMQLLAQNSLSDRDQGMAGGLANCTTSLTSSLVAPLLAALELRRLSVHFGAQVADPSPLLSPQGRHALTVQFGSAYVHDLQLALGAALHDVFLVGFGALAIVVLWLFLVVPTNAVARRLRLAPLGR